MLSRWHERHGSASFDDQYPARHAHLSSNTRDPWVEEDRGLYAQPSAKDCQPVVPFVVPAAPGFVLASPPVAQVLLLSVSGSAALALVGLETSQAVTGVCGPRIPHTAASVQSRERLADLQGPWQASGT